MSLLGPIKVVCSVVFVATLSTIAHATPLLTYLDWDASQTSKFFQGTATSGTSCYSICAGKSTWVGNSLSLEYSKDYVGGAAWASTSNLGSTFPNPLPSPVNAVGIAFEVTASTSPTNWVAQLNLGTPEYGMGASETVYVDLYGPNWMQVKGDSGGGIPTGNGQFSPLIWSFFPMFDSTYVDGTWSVQMFYPDQWLFDRSTLAEGFKFFATNTHSGPDNLVDGITQFDNVRWILSDPFPVAPTPCTTCTVQPPSSDIPEPNSLTLFALALAVFGLLKGNRRHFSSRRMMPV